jgi:hypothetical protein
MKNIRAFRGNRNRQNKKIQTEGKWLCLKYLREGMMKDIKTQAHKERQKTHRVVVYDEK